MVVDTAPEGGAEARQNAARDEAAGEAARKVEADSGTGVKPTPSPLLQYSVIGMDDIDGDGQLDLVSETSERVAFHLAKPEIEARPTWSLDLSELRSAPSASDLDLDNLLGAVSGLAQWRAVDLDGEGPRDLIVSSEGTFKVYRGATLAGPTLLPTSSSHRCSRPSRSRASPPAVHEGDVDDQGRRGCVRSAAGEGERCRAESL